jgi:ABC-type uncharacterized transport system involved in gliding motility auxiliary subunit
MISFFEKLNQNRPYLIIQFFLLFILSNYFLSDFNCRKDLSKENRFNLTESTEKIINNLTEKLIIDAFYSGDVPGMHKARLTLTKEIIKEIAGVNRKKVELRFHDPDSGESERKKANEAGIRSYPLEKVERGSAEVKQAYFGIRITLGNQTEVIPVAYSAENIEYQLLNLLKKMTRKGKQSNLGIVKVEGAFNYPEPSQSSSKDTFGVFIHKVYSPEYGEPTEVNLNQEEVNSEISTLLLVGAPRLTEQGMYHLDQYLMKGGNLIYLAETMKFSLPSGGRSMPGMGMSDGFATAIESAKNMRDFTSNYGFEVKSEMILEPDSSLVTDSFVQLEEGMIIPYHYPLWPVVTKESKGLSKESELTKTSSGIVLPWTSGITVIPENQPNASILTVIESTKDADIRSDYLPIAENQISAQPINPGGIKIPMGVYISGRLKSKFTKDNLPPDFKLESFISETPENKTSKIFVIGTPYLISDIFFTKEQYVDVFRKTNLPFFLNLLDIFSGDTDLIATRTKQSYVQNLKSIGKLEQMVFSIMNLFLIPIGISIYAFLRIKSRNLGKG